MKLDPGIHMVMHSVLSLKPGVTAAPAGASRARNCKFLLASLHMHASGKTCIQSLFLVECWC